MVQAERKEDFLNEDEVVATAVLLIIAGHETTSHLLANGLLTFLRHLEQIDLLRSEPARIGPAVEECLRYDPPVTATVRWATEDSEIRPFHLDQNLRRDALELVQRALVRRRRQPDDHPVGPGGIKTLDRLAITPLAEHGHIERLRIPASRHGQLA